MASQTIAEAEASLECFEELNIIPTPEEYRGLERILFPHLFINEDESEKDN